VLYIWVINRIADSAPALPLKCILMPEGSSIIISAPDEANRFWDAGKQTGANSSDIFFANESAGELELDEQNLLFQ